MDERFRGIKPAPDKILLSSPTMHGEEQHWVNEAFRTNWVTTLGANITAVEDELKAYVGRKEAVALSAGTAALHLGIRLAGEKLYGAPKTNEGTLAGRKVFCSDMTFDATVNPVAYEGGEAVFIDTERDSWNMDPAALEKAFEIYPEVKLVVMAHLYGTPGKAEEIREIADRHGALIIEDAAESLGAGIYVDRAGKDGKGASAGEAGTGGKDSGNAGTGGADKASKEGSRGCVLRQTGCFGDISVISFNGNKIITGSSGGMLFTDSAEDARKIRKWSTQARDNAPWYQHTELGYNYRMSNIVAGVVRGQIPYLAEHIEKKKEIYEGYREGLSDLPVKMNPIPDNVSPNYWLSCMIIDPDAMCYQKRTDNEAEYRTKPGKSCPTEILTTLSSFNVEGRPIWKPMHMQPIYAGHAFVTAEGAAGSGGSANSGAAGGTAGDGKVVAPSSDNGADIFERGLCLPSDNKMTAAEQDFVTDIIHRCFR